LSYAPGKWVPLLITQAERLGNDLFRRVEPGLNFAQALVEGMQPLRNHSGAADGGDEPWFAEAQGTVFLDLKKADETLKAFTKSAADFKIESFAKTNPEGFTSKDAALNELVGKLGYSGFLEASDAQLKKTWDALHPPSKAE